MKKKKTRGKEANRKQWIRNTTGAEGDDDIVAANGQIKTIKTNRI